jgi:hypothetical protein
VCNRSKSRACHTMATRNRGRLLVRGRNGALPPPL